MIKLKSLLSENTLTEAFKDKNGYVWPHFKDQAAVDVFGNLSALSPITTQTGDVWKIIFGDVNNADAKIGADGVPDFFLWYYWGCQALNPNRTFSTAVYDTLAAANQSILAPGEKVTLNYLRNYYPEIYNYVWRSYGQVTRNIEWWDKPRTVKYPKDDPKAPGVSRWQLFTQYYIKPLKPKMDALWVKTTPKPATPATNPGAAKAPVKQ
jgi:hypothetical protein